METQNPWTSRSPTAHSLAIKVGVTASKEVSGKAFTEADKDKCVCVSVLKRENAMKKSKNNYFYYKHLCSGHYSKSVSTVMDLSTCQHYTVAPNYPATFLSTLHHISNCLCSWNTKDILERFVLPWENNSWALGIYTTPHIFMSAIFTTKSQAKASLLLVKFNIGKKILCIFCVIPTVLSCKHIFQIVHSYEDKLGYSPTGSVLGEN